ncbi:Alpha-L-arabinofuranosidase 1 [Rhynchospora pubera]|uniref:non-reducing end alpha-L-arabinofuranosidase n=1 Tax=Rhynchospora pubera TaxID=906938 RepID=A0AAV8GVI9_9POAL|nr:Alpha-L-arabinofuranosidase 1 [Rhynchospora pubera]KAJ4807296.1 Alpha-L-arabinofuranosidase 1 [Rhynchospora pubera]
MVIDFRRMSPIIAIYVIFLIGINTKYGACDLDRNKTAILAVDASADSGRKIPDTLFGIFFEEINHAGAGGIWAELVNNRGFEAGGQNTPSDFSPWAIIGNESTVFVGTDRSAPFKRNAVALRVQANCDADECPSTGVGVYNPGFWGMNIEDGKGYKLILYVKSLDSINISTSLTTSDGLQTLATSNIVASASDVSNWTKVQLELFAIGSTPNGRLQLTTNKKGVFWLDQVSLMPMDTFMGHGFREDLVSMLADLKPRFVRFPGGCYVEGERLSNAFRWTASIGPWEERPGHYGDVWQYWTDDGLGYFEFLQLAEDLGASPVWVINNGVSHRISVSTTNILPWVQDALNSIEFARGDASSTWGSVRASMGHPDPFDLKYIAVGNEDCGKKFYRGNYLKFYNAIKEAYPDIEIISNCDGSRTTLDHPADYYDYHIYTSTSDMYKMKDFFNSASRSGPKAFVSEYAVTDSSAGTGSLLASLGEAAFLIGLEKNSDVVEMASYAPLFVNANDRRWNPDAIVFNSAQMYGTPSYWMQHFFKESSGAVLNPTYILPNLSSQLAASAVTWKTSDYGSFLKIKIVNIGSDSVNLKIMVSGLTHTINSLSSSTTILTSHHVMDENSFLNPTKVVPQKSVLTDANTEMDVVLSPHSFTSFDLALEQTSYAADM